MICQIAIQKLWQSRSSKTLFMSSVTDTELAQPIRHAEPLSGHSPRTPEKRSWFIHTAAVLTLATVVLSLFGYGILIGLSTTFGFDPGMFSTSPFDLLMACWAGVLTMFTALDKASLWGVLAALWVEWLVIASVGTILVLSLRVAKPCRLKWSQWIKRKKSAAIDACTQGKRSANTALWSTIAFFWLWPVISVALGWLFVVTSIFLLISIPSVGFTLGRTYAQQYVIAPKGCAQIHAGRYAAQVDVANNQQKGASGALCVRVNSIDKEKQGFERTGRLVLSSAHYVFLFDKTSGIAERIPIANMRESTVSALPETPVLNTNEIP